MRIRSRLERLEEAAVAAADAPSWLIRIHYVDARRTDCDGPDPEERDPDRKAREPMVFRSIRIASPAGERADAIGEEGETGEATRSCRAQTQRPVRNGIGEA